MSRAARHVPLALLVVLVVFAGCSGGPDRVVASGTAATVTETAVAESGYEYVGTSEHTVNTTVEASISGDVQLNAERPVTATVPVATYRRSTERGPVLALVASAPAVRPISNQPLVRNPLTTLSTATLLSTLQSEYRVESVAPTGNATVRFLGNETTARTYEAASREDATSDLTVAVASVRDGEEFVTVVAVGPRGAVLDRPFRRLLTGIRH